MPSTWLNKEETCSPISETLYNTQHLGRDPVTVWVWKACTEHQVKKI